MSTLTEKTLKAREKRSSYLANLDEKQCAAQIINNITKDYLETNMNHAADMGLCEVSFLIEAMEIPDCSNKMNNRQFANKTFTEVRDQLQKGFGINRVQYSLNATPDYDHIVYIGWCDKYPEEQSMLKKFMRNFF
jgi:hypothetical protein